VREGARSSVQGVGMPKGRNGMFKGLLACVRVEWHAPRFLAYQGGQGRFSPAARRAEGQDFSLRRRSAKRLNI
jgi:hypothetical protein